MDVAPYLAFRPCLAADVARLEEWLPSGLTGIHARRFGHQEAGTNTFLVTWVVGRLDDGNPRAAALYLRLG